MKHMKRYLAVLLAVMMVLSMGMTASAEGEQELGSITINGVGEKTTYKIYKLLKLESYNKDSGAYSYTADEAWKGFFATEEALAYVAVTETGYVTWIASEDDDTVAAFAKLALAYAKTNGISPVKSSKNEGEFVVTGTTGKFSELDLGYYLIDSTMGALCGLTTTNPDASINAKNGQPTIDKQVKEDSTNQWGDSNTADIGQIMEFRVTINVHAGAENYILHDVMSNGLTFQGVTNIEHVRPGASGDNAIHSVPTDMYEVKEDDAVSEAGDSNKQKCTFEVHFKSDLNDELETNDKLIVYYTAMLNRNAVIAGDGNVNSARLEYGENNFTTVDETTTKTYAIDIVKTDSQNTLIDGAKFKIYDAAEGGNEVGVVLMDDGVTYRRAREDEQKDGKTIPIDVNNGKVRVVGFDNGTYYLEEIEAPAGYNKITVRQKFIISDSNLDAVFNNDIFSTGSGVHVVNKTGTMLPETGGFGTSMFLTVGGFMLLAAVVLLATKRRMANIVD